VQGFFDIPVDNLFTEPLFIRYIKMEIPDWRDSIIVSPDAGGAKRATAVADKLGVDFALINRRRDLGMTSPERMEILVGEVKGKVAILVDDMIDTGHTVALAAHTLKDNGAKAVYALIAHGVLADANLELIASLPIDRLVVTNTVAQHDHTLSNDKLVVIDVAGTLAEAIRRLHNGESISLLFSEHDFML